VSPDIPWFVPRAAFITHGDEFEQCAPIAPPLATA